MERIGIKTIRGEKILSGVNLKADLLFFDKIILTRRHEVFQNMLRSFDRFYLDGYEEFDLFNQEVEYLVNKDLLIMQDSIWATPYVDNGIMQYFKKIEDEDLPIINRMKEIYDRSFTSRELDNDDWELSQLTNRRINLHLRLYAHFLRAENNIEALPILHEVPSNLLSVAGGVENSSDNIKKSDIVNLVINKIPEINTNVSWEEIFDFRENSDIKARRLALVDWINEMSNKNSTTYEVEQKLEYLLAEYEETLRKYKIKYNMSTAELVVTTTAEVLENMATFRWSKAAKTLFNLSKKNVDLLIAETKIPGREVAYISKIKELNK